MISDTDRSHGAVFRQLVLALPDGALIAKANSTGRLDAFTVFGTPFLIKHSSKRLSPWRFSLSQDSLAELRDLTATSRETWLVLVCGCDGVVALSADDLAQLVDLGAHSASQWVAATRSRSGMYRVSGSRGLLPRAKARGLHDFAQRAMLRRDEVLRP